MESMKNDVGMSWEMVRLDDLCRMNSGGTPSRSNLSFYNGEIPWAKISDIENAEGGVIQYTEEHITAEGLASINNRIFEKGTLLLAMYGSVGKVAFAGMEMTTNQAILGIKIKDESKISYAYLKYWFQTIKEQLLNRAVGGTLQNISLGIVKELQIPLPPLPIQKRIAEILDAADALKRKDQALLKKYDELAQAIFIDMFGDPVKNEKGWEVKKLGNLFSSPVKCGPFGSALKKEEYVNDGIPVWIMDNIQDYNFNENGCLYINEDKYLDLTSYSALKGDIIISRAGTVGKMCVLDSEFKSSIISTNLIKISLNEKVLNPYFFVKLMKYFGKKIGRLRTGSENGFTHMNTGVLAGLEFPLPTIPKQNEYINVLKNINYQIQFLGTNPENLFQALIQKAFKGELVK
jgi:type I restriction enzyme S subunit